MANKKKFNYVGKQNSMEKARNMLTARRRRTVPPLGPVPEEPMQPPPLVPHVPHVPHVVVSQPPPPLPPPPPPPPPPLIVPAPECQGGPIGFSTPRRQVTPRETTRGSPRGSPRGSRTPHKSPRPVRRPGRLADRNTVSRLARECRNISQNESEEINDSSFFGIPTETGNSSTERLNESVNDLTLNFSGFQTLNFSGFQSPQPDSQQPARHDAQQPTPPAAPGGAPPLPPEPPDAGAPPEAIYGPPPAAPVYEEDPYPGNFPVDELDAPLLGHGSLKVPPGENIYYLYKGPFKYYVTLAEIIYKCVVVLYF